MIESEVLKMFKAIWVLLCKTMMEKWKRVARDADMVFSDVHKNDWVVDKNDPLTLASIYGYDQVHKWSERYSKALFGTTQYSTNLEES